MIRVVHAAFRHGDAKSEIRRPDALVLHPLDAVGRAVTRESRGLHGKLSTRNVRIAAGPPVVSTVGRKVGRIDDPVDNAARTSGIGGGDP